MHSEKERERYASEEELKILMQYLSTTHLHKHAAFVRLLLLTGSRPQALGKMSAAAINRLPDGTGTVTFNGKCHTDTLTFSKAAMSQIDAGALDVSYRAAYRFWQRVQRDNPSLKNLWLRDLRRTFATIGLSNGVPLDHIGRVLNHRDPKVTLKYAKLMDESKSKAVDAVADALEEIIS
jgi:integrase